MAENKIKYSSYRWILHLLVWAIYFSITILPVFIVQNVPLSSKLYFIAHFVILVATVYLNIYLLMKVYFHKDLYRQYLISILVLWLFGCLCTYLSGIVFNYPPESKYFFKKTVSALLGYSAEFFVLSLFKVAKELYFKYKRSKELEFEKMQAELGLLRSQLDAHFLFNTLNNLYLLVLNKSDKAPDAILMLSDLLSYNIYDSRQDKVDIVKECEFIENYINLQKLRLNNDQNVSFEVEGEKKGVIEPLILFNFIENAFKHAEGSVVVAGKKYYIYIKILLEKGCLELKIINGYKSKEVKNKGVGIENAKKRLDMLYSDTYTLNIDRTREGEYHLYLKINELQ